MDLNPVILLSPLPPNNIISGNLETNEAESMIEQIEHVLYGGSHPICQPLFPSQHLTNRVVKLEKGKSYFYSANGLNPSDENSALVHYIQVILSILFCWVNVSRICQENLSKHDLIKNP